MQIGHDLRCQPTNLQEAAVHQQNQQNQHNRQRVHTNENVPNLKSVMKGKWHVACTRNQYLNQLNQSIAFACA